MAENMTEEKTIVEFIDEHDQYHILSIAPGQKLVMPDSLEDYPSRVSGFLVTEIGLVGRVNVKPSSVERVSGLEVALALGAQMRVIGYIRALHDKSLSFQQEVRW